MSDAADAVGNAEVLPECISALATALESLGNAIVECRREGIEPADAFRSVGVHIPSYAAPVLNMMFRENADAAETAAPGAASIAS